MDLSTWEKIAVAAIRCPSAFYLQDDSTVLPDIVAYRLNRECSIDNHEMSFVKETRSLLPAGFIPILRLVAGWSPGTLARHDDDRLRRRCHHQTLGGPVESGRFGGQRVFRTGRHWTPWAQHHSYRKRIFSRFYYYKGILKLHIHWLRRIGHDESGEKGSTTCHASRLYWLDMSTCLWCKYYGSCCHLLAAPRTKRNALYVYLGFFFGQRETDASLTRRPRESQELAVAGRFVQSALAGSKGSDAGAKEETARTSTTTGTAT